MKKRIAKLLITGLLAVLLTACGKNDTSADKNVKWKQIYNAYGITYQIPDSWKESENNSDDESFFYKNGIGEGDGMLYVSYEPDVGNILSEDTIKKFTDGLSASSVSNIQTKKININDSQMLETKYSQDIEGTKYACKLVAFNNENDLFVMSMLSNSENAYDGYLTKILESVEFDNKYTSTTSKEAANSHTSTKAEFDIDKCISDLQSNLKLNPDYSYVQDYYISAKNKKITISVVVDDYTNPQDALEFADTLVRQLNLYATTQDSSIEPSSLDYYGGLYDRYSALVGVSPASSSNNTKDWYIYDAIASGKTKLKLNKKYR